MKKVLLFLSLLILSALPVAAQNTITFKVEELSKPKKLLPLESTKSIYKSLIRSDLNLSPGQIRYKDIDLDYHILAMSKSPDSLVSYGSRAFFKGLFESYAHHRPFVLSPDMIWLLIVQGFAQHVNANAEELRHYFVDFSGKTSLITTTNKHYEDPTISWKNIIDGFSTQIDDVVGQDLTDILTSDFSTTSPAEKVASQITIMNAMKSYFEFISINIGCGIPKIQTS